MISQDSLLKYHNQFDDLGIVVGESNRRVVTTDTDLLFSSYVNVFTKAYLVSACSILEAFLQEMAASCLDIIDERINKSKIPHNLVLWSMGDPKPASMKYEMFKTGLSRKDISDVISGNYYKTLKTFQYLGIDLSSDAEFLSFKDFVATTVDKRNRVVHHNDDATDISLADILNVIETFKSYTSIVYKLICMSAVIKAESAE